MGTPGSLPSQEPYQSTPVTPTGRQRAFCVSDKEVLALSISRNRGGPSQFLATLWELRELASTVVPGLSSLERSQTTRNWPERRAETKKKCSQTCIPPLARPTGQAPSEGAMQILKEQEVTVEDLCDLTHAMLVAAGVEPIDVHKIWSKIEVLRNRKIAREAAGMGSFL